MTTRTLVFDSPFLLGFEHTRALAALADGMEVSDAILEHGLLHITVLRPEPEKLVRRIPIRAAG